MRQVLIITILLLLSAVTLTAEEKTIVTVYNSNLGVVSETRSMDFTKGTGQVAVQDVPTAIDATSVTFELVNSDQSIAILEQNYAYDLVSPDQIYRRYIDKQIELIDKDGKLYSGTLLSVANGSVTLSDENGGIKIILLGNIAEVNFPVLPDGLITKPTLFWRYISDVEGKVEGTMTYQTSGINWSAEYVGILNENEDKLNLSGWSSITNNSGKTYKDAILKLVAGDINRVQDKKGAYPRAMEMSMATMDAGSQGFEEKAFFEYHMYTLPRTATIANREVKQIALFEPADPGIKKAFVYNPDRNPTKVAVMLKCMNSENNNLGIPLPAGRVRLFKADDDGSLVLLGEDKIDHTPKNEELEFKVGYAFDITAEERVMAQNRISKKVEERDFEIELNNRKNEPVTIEVEKRFYGDWEIIAADFEYTKKDAYTLQFNIDLAAEQSKTVKYKVRFTY